MGKIGKDHWRSSSPSPLLKKCSLEQISQVCVQADYEHLQTRRLLNLPGLPAPVLSHSYSKFLPHAQVELHVFQKMSFQYCKRYFVN